MAPVEPWTPEPEPTDAELALDAVGGFLGDLAHTAGALGSALVHPDRLIETLRHERDGLVAVAKGFSGTQTGSLGGLRSWMDRTWHSDTVNIGDSEVHRLIVENEFPIIYTTNYDRWLEIAFEHYRRPYSKITNVTDLVRIRDGATQIVKFHGDFDDDRSLVLDESSYFERLEFESPLDIKLRSDVLARSVLFIGYSLSDVSLRYLFYKLDKLWRIHGKTSARPRSYIFVHKPNPVQEAVLDQWGISMISSDKAADPKTALVEFLQSLKSQSEQQRPDSPGLRVV